MIIESITESDNIISTDVPCIYNISGHWIQCIDGDVYFGFPESFTTRKYIGTITSGNFERNGYYSCIPLSLRSWVLDKVVYLARFSEYHAPIVILRTQEFEELNSDRDADTDIFKYEDEARQFFRDCAKKAKLNKVRLTLQYCKDNGKDPSLYLTQQAGIQGTRLSEYQLVTTMLRHDPRIQMFYLPLKGVLRRK